MMMLRYQPHSVAQQSGVRNGGQPWTPAADVVETEREYLLTFDLPGVSEQDVEIRFHEGALILEGERKTASEGYVLRERQTGPFRRNFRLPHAIDADGIAARFDRGVLEVRIPKVDRSRRISIQ